MTLTAEKTGNTVTVTLRVDSASGFIHCAETWTPDGQGYGRTTKGIVGHLEDVFRNALERGGDEYDCGTEKVLAQLKEILNAMGGLTQVDERCLGERGEVDAK